MLTTRASNNYGPYQYPEKALPLMITNFMEDQPFPAVRRRQAGPRLAACGRSCAGDPSGARKGRLGEIYNIGGSYTCRNKGSIQKVLRLMDKPNDLVARVEDRKGHDRRYALDCSKLKRLGFRHAYDFEKGLARTVAWYLSNAAWWRPLKVAGRLPRLSPERSKLK